jgi:hypothetical protein
MQAVLWPLVGAAVILTARRLLPHVLVRLVALVAGCASLATLWSLRTATAASVEIAWLPLNFFRASPTFRPDALSLFAGITCVFVVTCAVLGFGDSERSQTTWHGLILIALAGSLILAMAANLLTLALGSALIDLALMAMALSASEDSARVAWRMAVPGVASTLLLALCAVQMDVQAGTSSLAAREFSLQIVGLIGVAGVLRLMVFPLHPRILSRPQDVITLVVLAGAGICVLARSQTIIPALASWPWTLILAIVALIAGAVWLWAKAMALPKTQSPEEPGAGGSSTRVQFDQAIWPGIAVYQAGLALAFVLLLGGSTAWPLVSLALGLGLLAIWWDSEQEGRSASSPRWLVWVGQQAHSGWKRLEPLLGISWSGLDRWRNSWLGRYGRGLLLVAVWVSLIGAPLTAGALGRWPLYAALLRQGDALALIGALVADTFLVAGLWTAFGHGLMQVGAHRVRPLALVAMLALAFLSLLVGITPGRWVSALGLQPTRPLGVSAWGLGLIYVLPWLVGTWFARVGAYVGEHLSGVGPVISLDWLFRMADWAGQRLVDGVHWLGQVGEGDGWWGWALVLLALGAIFLAVR